MRKTVIGVMGPGNATERDRYHAYELGQRIATAGWVLLTGGRNVGVMDAASRGAKEAGGLTVGILPTADAQGVSEAVDLAIITGMGSARNNINILSSDVVIACGMSTGTASEAALALNANKPLILLTDASESQQFFTSLSPQSLWLAANPEEAIALVKMVLAQSRQA
jgi:hypothetical protein